MKNVMGESFVRLERAESGSGAVTGKILVRSHVPFYGDGE
jgi:hypothetical protein